MALFPVPPVSQILEIEVVGYCTWREWYGKNGVRDVPKDRRQTWRRVGSGEAAADQTYERTLSFWVPTQEQWAAGPPETTLDYLRACYGTNRTVKEGEVPVVFSRALKLYRSAYSVTATDPRPTA